MVEQEQAKRRLRTRRRRRVRQRRITTPAIIVTGLMALLIAGWFWQGSRPSAREAITFDPEDVAYDQLVHAIHEMNAGPPIPFLPKDGPQPQIAVNEGFHNFGSVGPTDVVTKDFIIANQGTAPLTISRAYTTCGCTTADLTSAYIPPGMVAVMTVRFDAGFHDTRGQTVRRGVILENNDPRRSKMEVWFQASVRPSP